MRLPSAATDNHVNQLVLTHDRTVGFRYYNPQTGRYISRDPIGYKDGPNVYCYVKNNPINRIDPLGLSEASGWGWSWWDVIPGVQIVHALYDTGAAIGSVTTVPIARGTMNLINGTSSGTNTIQHVINGGTPPNTAGDEHAWKQIQDGANDIASAVPGTTFTGPVTGPNKVGFTPTSLEKPLANGASDTAVKAGVKAATGDASVTKVTWYHGTSSTHLKSLEKGLDPEKAGTAKGGIEGFFVTSDPEVAAQYAKLQALETGGSPVILSAPGTKVGQYLDNVPNPAGGEMVIPKSRFQDVTPGAFKVDERAMKKVLDTEKK